MIPNEMHQFYLLYMPTDLIYGNEYKYIRFRIEVAFRYKVARPMRTKLVKDVPDLIADIYMVGPLTYPKVLQCDYSSEFKGGMTKLLEGYVWSDDMIHNNKVLAYSHSICQGFEQATHRATIQCPRCARVEQS